MMQQPHPGDEANGLEIAIVGMAGRFPGAADIDAFWRNLRDGVESVVTYSDAQLRERGVPQALLDDPDYVKAGMPLDGIDQFDAGFFGYTPRDAEHLDPQQRLFLECAWAALEHAGYDAGRCPTRTGVYGGSGASLYLIRHLLPHCTLADGGNIAELLGLLGGNMADALCTRVAYKLNLKGPAVTVQTACSTSLTAVHTACQGLLGHECDLALAGGVSLNLLQNGGYRYQAGAILSPDGHCRAFDSRAAGTLLGSGAGVVVLKRLDDALRDGDTVHAVIKGSAANNDGADKVGFTAPGVAGQAGVIRTAQLVAGVTADTIGYIEAHGTGTVLGDPIEIAALTQAFRADTTARGCCAIGSVKTNIGHLDAAAGVAGLIKTVLALKHRTLPASLHFEQPNPQLNLADSPFYVNAATRPWPQTAHPRRAGVSSFGFGGTNVHVVLEEAPSAPPPNDAGCRVLLLSARSADALAQSCRRLADHLEAHPGLPLADVAHTLCAGRRRFAGRAAAVGDGCAALIQALRAQDGPGFHAGSALSAAPAVAFLFPGQGAQHAAMGAALYRSEAVFRDTVDRCSTLLLPQLGIDLRTLLLTDAADEAEAAVRLAQTALTQPALFVVEYALAQLWLSWGVRPDAMLGHSIGEYVAACVAGVFGLEGALTLVAARGRLLQAMPPGAMLAVALPEAQLAPWLQAGCDLAAVNAADLCVLSGPEDAIAAAGQALAARGVAVRRLQVSHAFHSASIEPLLGEFGTVLSRVAFSAPQLPFVSNLSGRWITAEEACSPDYWMRHARGTVRFADGLGTLLARADRILLEVGPGETLSTLARRHPAAAGRPILASQCHPQRRDRNAAQPADCLAQLWVAGIDLDTAAVTAPGTPRRRVPLPTYPFERQRYWIDPPTAAVPAVPMATAFAAAAHDGRYLPGYRRIDAAPAAASGATPVLLFAGTQPLAERLAEQLGGLGRQVIRVVPGGHYAALAADRYQLRPGERADYDALLRAVTAQYGAPARLVHLWTLDAPQLDEAAQLEHGFFSLLALAQAVAHGADPLRATLTVIAQGLEDVTGDESLYPCLATLHGPCKVIPQELPGLGCRLIDVVPPPVGSVLEARLAACLAAETDCPDGPPLVAYRGLHRWLPEYRPAPRDVPATPRLRQGGTYLITGGLGGIGLALARQLAGRWQARLVLLARTPAKAQPALDALAASGAQVLALAADVADAAALQAALAQARQRFGRIDGVIHAAGVPGGGMIADRSRAAVDAVFAPKLRGTQLLLAALQHEPPDFVLLCASLTALAGGFGQIDYCAANAFQDAYAAHAARQGGPAVFSVDWDTWRGIGMAAGQTLPDDAGLDAARGAALFEQVVCGPLAPRTVISSIDLQTQLERMRPDALLARALPTRPAERPRRARPTLSTPYTMPAEGLEQDLAALWTGFLGIDPIGMHDNLFELGGDSLLAIQLLAQVGHAYGVTLHPAAFLRTPTLAALAVLVETRLIEEIENADAPADPAPATL
ncbi:SDR family NAD(P)-dependent oxidoreductase [Chitiniphilus purpureus]|uniref:SDR family NAD(P)-dependent oxidoreductase n=1 Tax=Chitiniphilus purpureus TaxID=2981137 RepID=A0ABY6DPV9_9NEIS|nr:type I polyketide synthase [Chitiniphilus sp. CD1]UXY15521.1 SDR family NAD(P)-dependent oxidoreductase [Chitiniphilus sp. CD1]